MQQPTHKFAAAFESNHHGANHYVTIRNQRPLITQTLTTSSGGRRRAWFGAENTTVCEHPIDRRPTCGASCLNATTITNSHAATKYINYAITREYAANRHTYGYTDDTTGALALCPSCVPPLPVTNSLMAQLLIAHQQLRLLLVDRYNLYRLNHVRQRPMWTPTASWALIPKTRSLCLKICVMTSTLTSTTTTQQTHRHQKDSVNEQTSPSITTTTTTTYNMLGAAPMFVIPNKLEFIFTKKKKNHCFQVSADRAMFDDDSGNDSDDQRIYDKTVIHPAHNLLDAPPLPLPSEPMFYGGLNYIRANGRYPQLHINNIIARFTLGVSEIDLQQLAMRFGATVIPLKYGSQCCTKRKLTLEIRKRSNEWYCKPPTPLTACADLLRQHNLYDEMYHRCLQRDRLNSMRQSIFGGNYDYKIVNFMEPWAPQCTLMLYAGGKCSVSGIRSEDQGLLICWSFVRLLAQRCGIPATLRDFEIRNIACDTKLDYDVDLDKLAQSLGDLAEYKPRKYPACVVYDSHNSQSLVSLVYPNGNVVETGAKTYEEAEARHRRIVDKCAEFKISVEDGGGGGGSRARRSVTMYNARANRLLSAKIEQQRQHRLKVARIIQRMVMPEDVDDEDEDDGTGSHRPPRSIANTDENNNNTTTTTTSGASHRTKRSIVDELDDIRILDEDDGDDMDP
jgi:TATA-box binding protein (TBP) (component of TFIID and TFIIIB)